MAILVMKLDAGNCNKISDSTIILIMIATVVTILLFAVVTTVVAMVKLI